MKNYKNINVYDASNNRLKVVFDKFEKIYISFSGGKDSGVLLNLVLDYMKKNNIQRKIGLLFVDLEGQYNLTIKFISDILIKNEKHLDVFWVCLPLNLRNSVSSYTPFWCCWDENEKDKWIRPFPSYENIITMHNNPFSFYKDRMEFEEFVKEFGKWYSQGQKTAGLIGIRSDESLSRLSTITSNVKTKYKSYSWTTKKDNTYNCYPIYDWKTTDIWTANGKFGWDYNKLYDLFYKAGVPMGKMRICQPYGDDQKIGLNLFKTIEPDIWAKVVNRVSGANFGNIYCGTKMTGYQKVILPKNHTWKSYTKLLLYSLTLESRLNYMNKFIKFIKFWNKKGCGVDKKYLSLLPKDAVVTGIRSKRGKNKMIVKFKKIPDSLHGRLETEKVAPTWRRMATCILKNDYLCAGLSFSQTKNQIEKTKQLIQKYKKL